MTPMTAKSFLTSAQSRHYRETKHLNFATNPDGSWICRNCLKPKLGKFIRTRFGQHQLPDLPSTDWVKSLSDDVVSDLANHLSMRIAELFVEISRLKKRRKRPEITALIQSGELEQLVLFLFWRFVWLEIYDRDDIKNPEHLGGFQKGLILLPAGLLGLNEWYIYSPGQALFPMIDDYEKGTADQKLKQAILLDDRLASCLEAGEECHEEVTVATEADEINEIFDGVSRYRHQSARKPNLDGYDSTGFIQEWRKK
jgi:hypothetical protein